MSFDMAPNMRYTNTLTHSLTHSLATSLANEDGYITYYAYASAQSVTYL